MTLVTARTHHPERLIGVTGEPIDLDWSVDGATGMLEASTIQTSGDADFDDLIAEVVVEGPAQSAVAPGGPLASRERRWFRVRCRIDGVDSEWSTPVTVEAGLLDADDWSATPITMPGDRGGIEKSPSPMLRQSFSIDRPVAAARLYATSLGVHEFTIDGRRVGADFLAPGWTAYQERLLACTYDVTDLLDVGAHAIGVVLGDGWYRGRLGWNPDGDRCHYGTELAVLGQLEITFDDGTTRTLGTDTGWLSGTGSVLQADIYDGCTIDLRRHAAGWDLPGSAPDGWTPAVESTLDIATVEPWSAAPIREIETRPVSLERIGDRTTRIDVGQNISGFVRVTVAGAEGDTVEIRHAEVVESSGELHTRALRSAEATDRFVLASDAETVLTPVFTFHGFRYAEIVADARIVAVEAVAISSAMGPRSEFWCDHGGLRQLESNVRWSQRDNFVGLPTDCPQRDERLGWTGDAQAFASTASVLFDARAFWKSWLRDLAIEQTDAGVPSVVPNVVMDGEPEYGRAGWADAATIVPWAVYEAFGDLGVLQAQLPSMERWVRTLAGKVGDRGLLGGEFQFGDWLDPDAPGNAPHLAKTDGDFLANAFFTHSADLTARAAALLGESALAAEMQGLADDMRRRTWTEWADHAASTQTGCAVGIELEIAPVDERPALAAQLSDLVLAADGAVSTGFLGTPLVLPALSRHGHLRAAFTMLLRTGVRSWLYQVANGATTIWERWDAILPDGSIHDGVMAPLDDAEAMSEEGHMLSFNHYAYGAVVDWIYRNVGGLSPIVDRPGYEHFRVAPRPTSQVTEARLAIDTRFGRAAIDWRVDGGMLEIRLEVPFGTHAVLDLPVGDDSHVSIDARPASADAVLPAGTYAIQVNNVAITETGASQ